MHPSSPSVSSPRACAVIASSPGFQSEVRMGTFVPLTRSSLS
jgi:hypothetical protein